jgi:PadR family transcriptional regulator AphA
VEDASLTPSSYIVLGMIAAYGPATSYEIKRWADGSVGYFWPFSRSQLYAEPRRLAGAGLLEQRQEEGGRRRRVYSLTDAGRRALESWLGQPTNVPTEIRDLGLLKLYFSQLSSREDLVALAEQQAEVHRRRRAEYKRLRMDLADDTRAAFALATLRMGLLYEESALEFWREIAREPPDHEGQRPDLDDA